MTGKPTKVTQLAREYLKKFPKAATMTLAKKLAREHPLVFGVDDGAIERARSAVRRVRGNMGTKNHRYLANRTQIRENAKAGTAFEKLPKPRKLKKWQPFKIKAERILALSDVHVPYHHYAGLQMALEYGAKKDVDHILLLGDFMDFYSISRWEKDPEERDFGDEIHRGKMMLQSIRDGFPNAKMTYIPGNHEDRYLRYMRLRAPDLLGLDIISLENLLSLDHFGIDTVDGGRYIEMGKLCAIHGHEFGGSGSPVNAARGLFLKGLECCMCGHWHRTSQHTEPSMKGRVVATYGLGCLCDLHPDYARINKWNLGFGYIELHGDDFEVHNLRIQHIGGKLRIRR